MTVAPLPGRAPASRGHRPHHRGAEWAVRLAGACGLAFVVSVATVAIAYATGTEDAVEDTWFGATLAAVAFVGLFGSLAAFVLAIIARAKREEWSLLWLPLVLFPALILFVVLGEAFWWE